MTPLEEEQIQKYPRTRHLEDSRLQPGDEGMGGVPFSVLKQEGDRVVYEEKVDGGNAGFRFDGAGKLWAQSRGHYINVDDRSVHRERDFNLFKEWLTAYHDAFLERFEDRYIVFGENMAIAHSCFYDRLPNYFLEFDIYDLQEGRYLGTPERHAICEGLPIASVPVLYSGPAIDLSHMKSFAGWSCFRTPDLPGMDETGWRENMKKACDLVGDDYDARLAKMEVSGRMEGIYIKVERDGHVVDRYKWVNPDFVQTIRDANEHWQSRFPVPNLLLCEADIFPRHLVSSPPGSRDGVRPYAAAEPDGWAPWINSEWKPWEPKSSFKAPGM